jgi:hydrogenase expression/formation protein HypD
VTSLTDIDRAIEIAKKGEVILATFGDMMRVPGSRKSLTVARAEGADIRVVYSPMECLSLARENPDKKVVFFATGFETTSPSVAATVHMAESEGLNNFFLYSVHKIVPPALRLLSHNTEIALDGFMLPGHVSTIIGVDSYRFLAEECGVAAVIAGFGAEDILQSVLMLLNQIHSNNPQVEIQYRGAVRNEGNPKAIEFLQKYFTVIDAEWRGIGIIEKSGLALRSEYSGRDVLSLYEITLDVVKDPPACRCGDVLTGKITPPECKLFGKACTPEKPVGACMVSTEGSCAAYYKYGAR